MESYDEIRSLTNRARLRLKREEEQKRITLIEKAKLQNDGLYWKACEETFWPIIFDRMKSIANEGSRSFTFWLELKDIVYSGIEGGQCSSVVQELRTCLVGYLLSKNFSAKKLHMRGRHAGQHIDIKW